MSNMEPHNYGANTAYQAPPAYPPNVGGNPQSPPPQGFASPPGAYPPNYGGGYATAAPGVQVYQTVPVHQQPVMLIGASCPHCRVGVIQDDYSCMAIFLAIFFFPIGILCCLAMKERRCVSCRAIVG